MKDPKIPMEAKVRDRITGVTGRVTAYLLYLTGCIQYQVEAGKDNHPEAYWMDEQRLEVMPEEDKPKSSKRVDGRKGLGAGGPSKGPAAYGPQKRYNPE